MAKFINRLGTKALKFAVDVHIDKVQFDNPIATRLKLILKRGSHKVETKKEPALENGIARFDETLSINATLYYDKKRNAYLPKEGLLNVYTMMSQGSKSIGHVKFNIADVPTLHLQERTYKWPILDCSDPQATIFATVKVILLKELASKTEHHSDEESKHVSWVQNHSAVVHRDDIQVKNLWQSPEANTILKNSQKNAKPLTDSRVQKNPPEMNILSALDQPEQKLNTDSRIQKNPRGMNILSALDQQPEQKPNLSEPVIDLKFESKRVVNKQDDQQSKFLPYNSQGTNELYKEKFIQIEKKLETLATEKTNAELKLTEADNGRLIKRIEELEAKNQFLDREKIDLLLKIRNLEEKAAKSLALQKDNNNLRIKNKELEDRLQDIDLTSYELKIAEYEEMIRALRDGRSSLESGDRISALELEKLRKNLLEMETINRHLKSEKEQIESTLKRETTQLRVENVSLKAENERVTRLLQEMRKLIEDKEIENNRIRNENLEIKAFLKEYDVLNLKRAVVEAQKAVASITQEKERSEKSLLQIIDKLTNEYQELQAQLDGTSTNTNWSSTKRDADYSIQRLKKENESLQRKFQDQITKLYKEKQDLEVFLKDAQTDDTHQISLDSALFSGEPNKRKDDMQEEYDKLRQQIRLLESHNKNLSNEKDEVNRTSFEYESHGMRLRQKIEDLEKERIRTYEEKIQLQEILNQDKEDNERRLLKDKQELEMKVEELLLEREELSKNYRDEIQKLSREKEENAHKMKEVLKELEEKNIQVMKVKVESEKKMRESDIERSKLNTTENKLKLLSDEINALRDENEILLHEKRELGDQIMQLESENERILKQQDASQENIQVLEQQVKQLQKEIKLLKEKSKKVEEVQAMLESFTQEENELKGTLDAKEKEIDELKEQIEKLNHELSEVESIKQENARHKEDNEKLKTLYVEIKTDQKSKAEIEKLESKLAEYEAEIENLKAENEKITDYKTKIEDLEKEIEELKEENEKVEDLESRLKAIETAKAKLESQNLKLQGESANIRNEWLEADKKNAKLISNLRVLEENEKNLNAKINSLSQELINAKTNLGEVINIVFEMGSGDLIDTIETNILTKAA